MSTPVAWYVEGKARLVDGKRVLYAPYLALRPEAEAIQDLVMASLLEAEVVARGVRNSVNLAEGGEPNLSSL